MTSSTPSGVGFRSLRVTERPPHPVGTLARLRPQCAHRRRQSGDLGARSCCPRRRLRDDDRLWHAAPRLLDVPSAVDVPGLAGDGRAVQRIGEPGPADGLASPAAIRSQRSSPPPPGSRTPIRRPEPARRQRAGTADGGAASAWTTTDVSRLFSRSGRSRIQRSPSGTGSRRPRRSSWISQIGVNGRPSVPLRRPETTRDHLRTKANAAICPSCSGRPGNAVPG